MADAQVQSRVKRGSPVFRVFPYHDPPSVTTAPSEPNMDDRQILDPPPEDEARSITVVRGLNIVPPPEGRALPESLEGRIVIVGRGRRLDG